MTAVEDTVTALREQAEYLHMMSHKASHFEARGAYADAATRVDQIIIGPVTQAVLDQQDAVLAALDAEASP